MEDKYLKYTIHSKLKYAEFLGNNHLIVAKPLFYPCRTVLALTFFKDFTKEMVTDYVFL